MQTQFAKISRGIWWNLAFRSLPATSKLLFIHFFSHPQIKWCGLLQYPFKAIPADLGITTAAFRSALATLVKQEMVLVDHKFDLVFVINVLKWHPPRSSKDVKGIINILSVMPPTHLAAEIWESVEGHLEDASIAVQNALPLFQEAKADAHLPSKPEPNGNQTGTRLEPNRIRRKKKEERRKKKEHFGSGFDLFWKSYPRKVAQERAWDAWLILEPDDKLVATILKDLKARVNDPAWQETKFIPHPSTYLNQKRWTDEALGTARKNKWQEIEKGK